LSGYAGPISGSPGSAAAASSPAAASPPVAAPAKPAIKLDPGASAPSQGFLSQPMHVCVTGVNYNVVPACRTPPCGCGAKHGPNYKPGPHATWDCPFSYMARYGSCQGSLSSGQRNLYHWHGNALTCHAKDEWVALITSSESTCPCRPARSFGRSTSGYETRRRRRPGMARSSQPRKPAALFRRGRAPTPSPRALAWRSCRS
jgi:hypothetical protein